MTLTLVVARHSGGCQNPPIRSAVNIRIASALEMDTGYKHAGMTLTLVIARHSGGGQNPSNSGVVSIRIPPVLEVDTG